MSQPQSQGKQAKHRPTKKFSFGGFGPSVSVWHNTRDTANGPRITRTITISGSRYRDPQTSDWKEAALKPEEISAVLFLLKDCERWLVEVPVSSADNDDAA